MFPETKMISIEISNTCNYSSIHVNCPLHAAKEKKFLPIDTVYKVLQELGEVEYRGTVAFHTYNEPLIDPRLFLFLLRRQEFVPEATSMIWTNGFNLNEYMIYELCKYGVSWIRVSAYTKDEYERLSSYASLFTTDKVVYEVYNQSLDRRLQVYDENLPLADFAKKRVPCYAPDGDELVISVDGDVILCCLDWERRYKFGNVKEKTLEQILSSDDVVAARKALSSGERGMFEMCKHCWWSR